MAEHATGDQIHAEQVRHLYRLSRPAYAATLLNASVLVFALSGLIPAVMLGGWLCAIFAVTAARYLLYRAYVRAVPPPEDSKRWAGRFVVG
ncbi:MAG TPA: hypothetical protein VD839_15965, partial [Burkholderiales bacterium]|nr:hypothetical protein [Burkholderiales bacterium]